MVAFVKPTPPTGWAYCNGQQLQVTAYQALFSLIGNAYGGDGVKTFNLPDLRGRVPLNAGGSRTMKRGLGGAPNVVLTANQLPVHTHAFNASTLAGGVGIPTNNVWGNTGTGDTDYFLPDSKTTYTAVTMAPNVIGNAGASQPIPVQMPFTCIQFIIALVGIWPPRP